MAWLILPKELRNPILRPFEMFGPKSAPAISHFALAICVSSNCFLMGRHHMLRARMTRSVMNNTIAAKMGYQGGKMLRFLCIRKLIAYWAGISEGRYAVDFSLPPPSPLSSLGWLGGRVAFSWFCRKPGHFPLLGEGWRGA